ncbi:MAG: hypothetical protein AAGC55_22490, partial [Myxococcota bacterium]
VTGAPPYGQGTIFDVWMRILQTVIPEIPERVSPELTQLISGLLQLNPADRLTIAQAFEILGADRAGADQAALEQLARQHAHDSQRSRDSDDSIAPVPGDDSIAPVPGGAASDRDSGTQSAQLPLHVGGLRHLLGPRAESGAPAAESRAESGASAAEQDASLGSRTLDAKLADLRGALDRVAPVLLQALDSAAAPPLSAGKSGVPIDGPEVAAKRRYPAAPLIALGTLVGVVLASVVFARAPQLFRDASPAHVTESERGPVDGPVLQLDPAPMPTQPLRYRFDGASQQFRVVGAGVGVAPALDSPIALEPGDIVLLGSGGEQGPTEVRAVSRSSDSKESQPKPRRTRSAGAKARAADSGDASPDDVATQPRVFEVGQQHPQELHLRFENLKLVVEPQQREQ